MRWRGVGQTNPGKVREHNEDAFCADDVLGLYAVSDGMGGHPGGEVASRQAVASARQLVETRGAEATSRQDVVTLARTAVEVACRDVYQLASTESDKAGMGCTLTLVIVRDGYAAVGHVGDSRCYLRRDGEVSLLTADHTVNADLERAELRGPEVAGEGRARVLSRSVGARAAVQVDAFAIDLLAGDALLLCTDGLSAYVESPRWLGERLGGKALDGVVEDLIAEANAAGGHDNITAAVVSVEAADEHHAQLRTSQIGGRLRALGSVFLFEELTVGLLSRLLSHCEVQRFDEGETVIEQGARCDALVVVTEGSFELSRDGKPQGTLVSGNHAAISALLHPRPARATLRATQPGAVLMLHRRAFFRLVRARPYLGINLLERLATELSRALDDSVLRRDDNDPTTTPLSANEQV